MGGEADGEQETFTRNRRARGSCEGGREEKGGMNNCTLFGDTLSFSFSFFLLILRMIIHLM